MRQYFNEMYTADGQVTEHYAQIASWLLSQPPDMLANKRAEAELIFRRVGITFAVYGDTGGTERLIPFDIIPRIITRAARHRAQHVHP
jgi:uncharacterized circularly permuted ATP-grasp superfamily protein